AVSNRFMQHHSRPARAKYNIHFTSRSRNRLKIDQGLPYRFVDRALPGLRVDQSLKAFTPAKSVATRFLTVTVSGNHSNVEPDHRANVAIGFAIGAQDLDDLPVGGNAGRHLPHARILLTRIGVD